MNSVKLKSQSLEDDYFDRLKKGWKTACETAKFTGIRLEKFQLDVLRHGFIFAFKKYITENFNQRFAEYLTLLGLASDQIKNYNASFVNCEATNELDRLHSHWGNTITAVSAPRRFGKSSVLSLLLAIFAAFLINYLAVVTGHVYSSAGNHKKAIMGFLLAMKNELKIAILQHANIRETTFTIIVDFGSYSNVVEFCSGALHVSIYVVFICV